MAKKTDMKRVAQLQKNIRDFYNQYITPEMMQNEVWYHFEHDNIKNIAHEMGVNFEVFAAMVAMTSPQVKWDSNLLCVINLIKKERGEQKTERDYKMFGYPANRKKALNLYYDWFNGEMGDRRPLDYLNETTGNKTFCFASNLISPDTSKHFTVDVWMYRLAMREYQSATNVYKISAPDKRAVKLAYELFYEEIGLKDYGIAPHQMQSVMWTQVRFADVAAKWLTDFNFEQFRIESAFVLREDDAWDNYRG